jgi:parallel beta-helix repeat protein
VNIRLIFAFLLLSVTSPLARSTTYYVDSQNGNDSNNGTSATSAWHSLAKVNSGKFSPNDGILLRRGSIWREQLNFPSSGSPGAPIVIDAYGEGNLPLISGADLVPSNSWTQGSSAQIWQAPVTTHPNVVLFDGTKGRTKNSSTELAAPLDWFWNSGTLYVFSPKNPSTFNTRPGVETGARPIGLNLTGKSYITVRNIAVSGANAIPYGEGAGIWAITVHLEGPTPGNLNISHVTVFGGAGDGIHIENAENCIVDSNLVRDNEGAGIKLNHSNEKFPVTSGSITNNEVHNNSFNGIFVVGCPRNETCRSVLHRDGLVVTGVKITGNRVYSNGAGIYLHETNNSLVANNVAYDNTDTSRHGEGYCVGISGSSSNIIEKNECYRARLSGIELSIDTGRPPFGSSENIIRYNVVHDDGNHGIFTNYVPSQNNKIIYNLIYNHPQGACIMANYMGHEIYNNTCYNSRMGIHLYISATTQQTGHIHVKNNLFIRDSQVHVLIEPGVQGPFDFANNLYYPDGPSAFNMKGSTTNFADWRSNSGQDATSIVADPMLSPTGSDTAPSFAIRPGSPAVGRGANLGTQYNMALAPVLTWPNQVKLLPQDNDHWDIGAFHHTP